MEKVYLALDTAGLSAEKTKLESDYREGSAELRSAEVRGHTVWLTYDSVQSGVEIHQKS